MEDRSEAEQLAEVQERAEVKRAARAALPAAERTDMSKSGIVVGDSVDMVEVTRTCTGCGETFDCIGTEAGGHVIAPTICQECEWKRDQPEIPGLHDVRPIMDALGINMREHGRLTLADMDADGPASPARRVAEWCDEVRELGAYDSVDALYLVGDTGVGKSQLAVSSVRYLLEGGFPERRIVYDRARALATTVQDRYGTGTVDPTIELRRRAGLWVLEDVGAERHTPDSFRIMEDIMDRRMGHPSIWTSNLTPEALADRWSEQAGHERFQSRLAGFRFLTIQGEDRRFTDG